MFGLRSENEIIKNSNNTTCRKRPLNSETELDRLMKIWMDSIRENISNLDDDDEDDDDEEDEKDEEEIDLRGAYRRNTGRIPTTSDILNEKVFNARLATFDNVNDVLQKKKEVVIP